MYYVYFCWGEYLINVVNIWQTFVTVTTSSNFPFFTCLLIRLHLFIYFVFPSPFPFVIPIFLCQYTIHPSSWMRWAFIRITHEHWHIRKWLSGDAFQLAPCLFSNNIPPLHYHSSPISLLPFSSLSCAPSFFVNDAVTGNKQTI